MHQVGGAYKWIFSPKRAHARAHTHIQKDGQLVALSTDQQNAYI